MSTAFTTPTPIEIDFAKIGKDGRSLVSQVMAAGLHPQDLPAALEYLQQTRVLKFARRTEELPPAIVVEDGRVASYGLARAEKSIVRSLLELLVANETAEPLHFDVEACFGSSFVPHEDQVAAVRAAAASTIKVITGGPGTGKTTVVQAVVQMLRNNNLSSIVAMTPTGKAASRVKEQTGLDCGTIHRTLGVRGTEQFVDHEHSLLTGADAAIVDEASMIDTQLFALLLTGVQRGMRLVIVGDVDQLPSIGPGRVLHDLIESGHVPVTRLTKIFRQAEESSIPHAARAINEGRYPLTGPDVHIFAQEDAASAAAWAVDFVAQKIHEAYGIRPEECQVLSPQKSRECGVEALNLALQARINGSSEGVTADVYIGARYSARERDRVIHVQNNYQLGVFNGDVGRVVLVDRAGIAKSALPEGTHTSEIYAAEMAESGQDAEVEKDQWRASAKRRVLRENLSDQIVIVVEFEVAGATRLVGYTRTEARQLELAYAMTIHKSQGSEFRAVVLLVHSQHQAMLTRQLLYTGATRARELLVIIGEPAAIQKAVGNTRGAVRRTTLIGRLDRAVRDREADLWARHDEEVLAEVDAEVNADIEDAAAAEAEYMDTYLT